MLRPGLTEPLIALLAVVLLVGGCSAPLPKNTDRTPSAALPQAAETTLDRAVSEHLVDHEGETGLRVFGHSLDGFVARMMLADMAQRSIDAQYYLIDEGTTGTLFLNGLLRAAERGVRVRLLIDDIDLASRDALLLGLTRQRNFELRVFNPFSRGGSRGGQFLSRFGEVSRRMHNKSFTVDNRVSIIGGRNIATITLPPTGSCRFWTWT